MLRRSVLAAWMLFAPSGCGGGDSNPSTPTAPSGPRGALTVIAVDATSSRAADGGFEIRVSLRLRETGGQAVTVSAADFRGLNSSGAPAWQVQFQNPVGGTNRLAGGQELTTRTMTISGTASQTFPSALAVTVSFTDDGQNTGAANGQGDVPALRTATIGGFVRSGSTQAPLGGVTVTVVGGPSNGRTATTDGNGFYSIAVDVGSFSLSYALSGFGTVVRTVTINSDAQVDVTLSPPVAPAPDVEYRVTGSRADLTYANNQGGTAQESRVTLPWSYRFNGVRTGQFLYISAQNTGDSGAITVSIYKRGTLYRTTTSTGAFVIATASGSY